MEKGPEAVQSIVVVVVLPDDCMYPRLIIPTVMAITTATMMIQNKVFCCTLVVLLEFVFLFMMQSPL
ncbi:MAG: hypothetical protein OES23_01530 [Nitrosopumilus sp.]|nr:hypothetical protein [Nitrosopumilus sp.]